MVETILVATDGSDDGGAAERAGIALAARHVRDVGPRSSLGTTGGRLSIPRLATAEAVCFGLADLAFVDKPSGLRRRQLRTGQWVKTQGANASTEQEESEDERRGKNPPDERRGAWSEGVGGERERQHADLDRSEGHHQHGHDATAHLLWNDGLDDGVIGRHEDDTTDEAHSKRYGGRNERGHL